MKKILFSLFILSLSIDVFANNPPSYKLSVGAGLIVKKNNRINNNYEDLGKKYIFKPVPFLNGSVSRFSLGPQGLSVRAIGTQLMNVSAFIKRDGDKYNGEGMMPRQESAFVGISGKIFKYGLSVSKDINGRSKGYIALFNYGEFFNLSESFMIRAGLSLEWHDDKYAEFYYGVRANEATIGRREYHLSNYFQAGLNILPIYKISERHSLTAALGAKIIPKKVRQSPTMNGNHFDVGGLIGYNYTIF